MRILLAPMEGVVDYNMRELLTGLGGYDRCVTEFVRVTGQRLPNKVFYRYCPELHHGGQTHSGVPVFIQLLGGQPGPMADNAQRAEALGAPGIDLNFGCPSKTVNGSDGGSVLLREPKRVADIVRAVRDAVSGHIPVTAKIRLGFDDASLLSDIVGGIVEAGATELCIHARTRRDGYKPPAHWHYINDIRQQVSIPLIINGEIWSIQDAMQARQASGCEDLMLGRGALACPDLARSIQSNWNDVPYTMATWSQVLDLLEIFFETCIRLSAPHSVGNRLKQWLVFLKRHYPGANVLFQQVKRLNTAADIQRAISNHRLAVQIEDM